MGRIVGTTTLPDVAAQLEAMAARAQVAAETAFKTTATGLIWGFQDTIAAMTPHDTHRLAESSIHDLRLDGLLALGFIFQPAKSQRYRWTGSGWVHVGEGDYFYVKAVVGGRRAFSANESGSGKKALAGPRAVPARNGKFDFGPVTRTGAMKGRNYPLEASVMFDPHVRSAMGEMGQAVIRQVMAM